MAANSCKVALAMGLLFVVVAMSKYNDAASPHEDDALSESACEITFFACSSL